MIFALPQTIRRDLDSVPALELRVWQCLRVFAFCIPWSIAASQIVLVLTGVVAGIHWLRAGRPSLATPLDAPMLAFFAASLLAAVLGLDPAQSLWGLRTYPQVVVILIVRAHVRSEERMLSLVRWFLAGMVLTSTHTTWNLAVPWTLPEVFPGGMTESGQLVFAIGFAASLLLCKQRDLPELPFTCFLYLISLAANLKRGAWLGCVAALSTLGAIRSRLLLVGTAVIAVIAVAAAPPLRTRVENSARDFFQPGSRYDIWCAAVDVTRRFPMGIGRKNGAILRDYANIPSHHKHAHNNLLQVAMESGLLGLATFLWWMGRFGRLSFGLWREIPPDKKVARALAASVFANFLGFHVAGVVEFNFGDTEVLLVLFLMMGLALSLRDLAERERLV